MITEHPEFMPSKVTRFGLQSMINGDMQHAFVIISKQIISHSAIICKTECRS